MLQELERLQQESVAWQNKAEDLENELNISEAALKKIQISEQHALQSDSDLRAQLDLRDQEQHQLLQVRTLIVPSLNDRISKSKKILSIIINKKN